ncbi:MAG: DUF115 domain-containing protein [bacterium]|nr:DUF115 domain-containing protein [bacterium]
MEQQKNLMVVYIGRFTRTSGFSFAAKTLCEAIRTVDIPLLMVDIDTNDVVGPPAGLMLNVSKQGGNLSIQAKDEDTAIVAIFHDTPDRYPQLEFDGQVRRIGLHYFETDSYPVKWLENALEMDEIWTGSQFNKEAFTKGGIPDYTIDVIPHCLDVELYGGKHSPMKIPERKGFVFLTVVSNFNRRDIGMLLRAYFEGFKASDDVTLVIKCNARKGGIQYDKEFVSTLLPEYDLDNPELPHYVFIKDYLSDERMRSLYTACDAYVSIDRGKGWDLPAMETMAMSKPAIGIDWSASTEFMKPDNSFLLTPEPSLAPVDPELVTNVGIYSGHKWSRITDEALRDTLRKVFDDTEERERIAGNAGEYIKKHHNFRVVGEAIKAKLASYASYDFYLTERARLTLRPRPGTPAKKAVPPPKSVKKPIPQPGTNSAPAPDNIISDEDLRLIQVVIDEGRNLRGGYVYFNLNHKRMYNAFKKIRLEECLDGELVQRAHVFFTCPMHRVNRKRKKFDWLYYYAMKIYNAWKSGEINISSSLSPQPAAKKPQSNLLVPYVEGTDVEKWGKRRREMWGKVGGVKTDAHDLARLKSMKNKYLGERIFIIGNGPSLNKIDFNKLKNEYTFGVNKIYLMSERVDWHPTFYTCIDWRVGPDIHKEINQLGDGTTFFFPNRFRGLFREGDDVYWYWGRGGGKRLMDKFEPDIAKGVAGRGTVLVPVLQIAFYMGFRDIYLIGVDASFKVNKNVVQSGRDRFGTGVKTELTSTADDDPNHFDPRYFGAGDKWHDPNVDEIFRSFMGCRKGIHLNGGKLYNATIGGKLDVVERVDFDSLF